VPCLHVVRHVVIEDLLRGLLLLRPRGDHGELELELAEQVGQCTAGGGCRRGAGAEQGLARGVAGDVNGVARRPGPRGVLGRRQLVDRLASSLLFT
jgi:hypothetical protein